MGAASGGLVTTGAAAVGVSGRAQGHTEPCHLSSKVSHRNTSVHTATLRGDADLLRCPDDGAVVLRGCGT